MVFGTAFPFPLWLDSATVFPNRSAFRYASATGVRLFSKTTDFETDGGEENRAGKGRVRIGYARVSKRESNLALQLKALKGAGCSRIFSEKVSALAKVRPARARAVAALRPGDQFVVWKLDRFARDLLDQLLTLRDIQTRGASLVSLTEAISTDDWMGSIMSRQHGLYAEAELLRITERTRAGVAAALERGVRFGRPAKLTRKQVEQARRMIKGGAKAETVAAKFNVGRSTLYRYIAAA